MTIYLAGAVKADPTYRAKFEQATAMLTLQYPTASIVNPVAIADSYAPLRWSESELMINLFRQVSCASHIVRIADGQPSAGADLELAWAEYLDVIRLPDLELP